MGGRDPSPVVAIGVKDEGDFYFITLIRACEMVRVDATHSIYRPVGRPFDPNRQRPYGSMADAEALASEHGVPVRHV